jgi:hypothetical protein
MSCSGWVINVGRIIHSEEALLAIGFIFTVHFFNTHFVPTKWPMNYSIFTGRIYKWEFIEERSLEYDRLFEAKELEKLKVPFPNALGQLFSGAMGIGSLIVGLPTILPGTSRKKYRVLGHKIRILPYLHQETSRHNLIRKKEEDPIE